MPKISACMLMKNEESMLPRCLDSIKDLCDEIIIVDTGSTDKSVEIAESYGAKVYHHPWQNDFSLHRNQAHGYATGDWHFVIDCDEELVAPKIGFDEFKKRFDMLPPEIGALVVTENEPNNGQIECSWMGCRFFRATANLKWRNAVHNKGKYDGGCAGTDIVINHYGYHLGKEAMAKKRERTRSMLAERFETDPEDYDAMFYMCQMAMAEKNAGEAIKMGTKCFELVPIDNVEDLSYYSVLYYMLGTAYLWQRDGESSYAWAKKGLDSYPNDLDLNFLMARIGYSSKKDDLLKASANKYLELLPIFRTRHEKPELTKFENPVQVKDTLINRTVYTLSRESEACVRGWMDG